MKEQVLNRIIAVYNALDRITVSGKQNLINLSGSMAALEEVEQILSECEIEKRDENTK